MRPHPAGLLRPSAVGLRIRKPSLPMPAAEWFEFSSFSPSAGIRSQIQEIRRKAKPGALIKEVALASGQGRNDLGELGDGIVMYARSSTESLLSQGCFGLISIRLNGETRWCPCRKRYALKY